jgi:hypothetical protein
MKRIVQLLAGASLAVCMAAHAQSAEDIEQAKATAAKWLALADSNRSAATWTEADESIQKAVSQADWVQTMQTIRQQLGQVKSRSLKSAAFASQLPGAPDGAYVVIVYSTTYANKPNVTEVVTPARNKDGAWKVSGYILP